MIIKSIRLKNFMRYRGETFLELEPSIYAIVAETERNTDRSNWVGKSSLMESIVFGLYGRKPPRCAVEDDWITHGEAKGEVEIAFDDGTSILRHRTRNKATRVEYEGASQEGADRRLYERLGLSEDDFLATCYFEQRQMAKFVLAKPAQRQEMISGWFGLDKLEAACEVAKMEIPNLIAEKRKLETELAVLQARITVDVLPMHEVADMDQAIYYCELEIEKTKERLAEAERVDALYRRIEERDEIIVKGKALAASLGKEVSPEEIQVWAKMGIKRREELAVKKNRQRELNVILADKFDGICPLIRKACPSAGTITCEKKTMQEEASWIRNEVEELSSELLDSDRKQSELTEQARQYDRNRVLLDELRNRVKQINAQIGKDEIPDRMDKREVLSKLMSLQSEVSNFKHRLKQDEDKHSLIKETEPKIVAIRSRMLELDTMLKVHLHAVQLLGRNCAQRKVAESNLEEIAMGANDMLSMCGLDLNVGISWAREGKGLAKNCDACGQAFGTSTKIKSCVCGAPRGPEQISRLDVVLSDRSGAAEDLAGCAFQLSAASWLRVNRNASWSVALLDECFGSLDAHNRKAFARHLVSMLSGKYGFRQAFIISHSPDTTHLFPSRIQLTGHHDRTTAKVIL